MMRRLSGMLIGVMLILLAGALSAGAAGKAFVWQRLESDVQVLADGRLRVTEQLTLRFMGGPFTYVKRNLASAHLDSIGEIAVRDAEQSYTQVKQREGKTPYTFSVFIEDGVTTVRWVYPPTSDTERTFTLSYVVNGAVARRGEADEVWWPFVFPARAEVVEQAVGRLRLPAPLPAAQIEALLADFPGQVRVEPGLISVSATNVPPNQKFTLLVRFPAGFAGAEKPRWQLAEERQAEYDRTTRRRVDLSLAGGSAALLVILAAFLRRWRLRHRDPQPVSGWPAETQAPPEDLAPALAAHLVGASDAQAVSATLFDLTRRGYLSLHEEKGGWLGRSKIIKAVRSDRPATDLAPFEAEVLDLLFGTENEAILSKRSAAIIRALPRLRKSHAAALVERGYLDPRQLKAQTTATVAGLLIMIGGLLALIPAGILARSVSYWLPVIPGLLFLFGVIWLTLGASLRGVMPAGATPLAEWRGFRRYLKRLRPERAPLGQFERLLPYAAGLADAGRFIKVFKQSNEPLPAWYHPLAEGGGDAWAGVRAGLLLRDYGDSFGHAAIIVASSTGGGAGGAGGAGGGAGGGSAG